MKVLILGAKGNLGPHVVETLESNYHLRLTDISPMKTKHEFILVDASVQEQVVRAAEGMDAIINLSVLRQDRKLAFDVSTRGSYNMMQAAVIHSINRVINTGPHFVLAGRTYETFDYELNPDIPPQPGTNLYALSKSLGQEICKVFTEGNDVHVLCYLFYSFRDPNQPLVGADLTPFSISWNDAAEAFRLGLETNLSNLPSKCEIFNIFTDLPHQQFSNEKAKRLLGFSPRDTLSQWWHKPSS